MSLQSTRNWALLISFSIAALTLALLAGTLLASDRSVGLERFTVEPLADGRVHIEWSTGFEDDTAEFILIRTEGTTPPVYPSDAISVTLDGAAVTAVPAAGGNGGADYLVFDEDVVAGQTYTYVLVEIELNASINAFYDFARTITIGDLAQAGVAATPVDSFAISSGGQVTHNILVTNTGNRFSTILVQVSGSGSDWTTLPTSFFVPIQPGESEVIGIRVDPADTVRPCSADSATVRFVASEVFSSTASTTATVTTQLNSCIYLPIITR